MILDIRPALRAYLLADPGISALVATRVFPSVIPQSVGARTCIVYQGVSALGDHTMQGPSGLIALRMQLDAWSADVDECDDLANRIKDRIDGFRGTWPMASPANSIKVRGVFFDGIVPLTWDDDIAMHRVGRSYMIHYLER